MNNTFVSHPGIIGLSAILLLSLATAGALAAPRYGHRGHRHGYSGHRNNYGSYHRHHHRPHYGYPHRSHYYGYAYRPRYGYYRAHPYRSYYWGPSYRMPSYAGYIYGGTTFGSGIRVETFKIPGGAEAIPLPGAQGVAPLQENIGAPQPGNKDATRTTSSRGWTLLDKNRPDAAMLVFAAQAQNDPANGRARIGYALAAASMGDLNTAARAMRQACQIDAKALHYIKLGEGTKRKVPELIASYRAMIDRLDSSDAAFMLAALDYLHNDLAAARKAITRAIDNGDGTVSTRELNKLILEMNSKVQQALGIPEEETAEKPSLFAAPEKESRRDQQLNDGQ